MFYRILRFNITKGKLDSAAGARCSWDLLGMWLPECDCSAKVFCTFAFWFFGTSRAKCLYSNYQLVKCQAVWHKTIFVPFRTSCCFFKTCAKHTLLVWIWDPASCVFSCYMEESSVRNINSSVCSVHDSSLGSRGPSGKKLNHVESSGHQEEPNTFTAEHTCSVHLRYQQISAEIIKYHQIWSNIIKYHQVIISNHI